MAPQEILRFEKISKSFGSKRALDSVSFSVMEGEILGILGPNGAGKSTMMKIAAGTLEPEGGSIFLGGREMWMDYNARRKIAMVPQEHSFFGELTVVDNLIYFASQVGAAREKVAKYAAEFSLGPFLGKRAEELSGGYKRMLNICISLIQEPQIIFLDEPSVALDPVIRSELWEKIIELQKEGKTICISTHYMEEAQALCDRVCLINDGKIVALDTPDNLIKKFTISQIGTLTLKNPASAPLLCELAKQMHDTDISLNGTSVILRYRKKNPQLHEKAQLCLRTMGAEIIKSRLREADLEQAFINLTGHDLKGN